MTNLDINQCIDLINSENNLLILDVRSRYEFEGSVPIKNSRNISLGKLPLHIDWLDGYEETPILVYCKEGTRSIKACDILEDNGFTKIYNMIGGYCEWMANMCT